MLGAAMKGKIYLNILCVIMMSCYHSEQGDTSYEPLYLNETENDVVLLWSHPEESFSVSEIVIHPKDTAYCLSGMLFPVLLKSGLHGSENFPLYKVRLVFYGKSKKCISFEGDSTFNNDIRLFSSYESIGLCNFCVERAMSVPDGMLYRITDELLEQAKPCE